MSRSSGVLPTCAFLCSWLPPVIPGKVDRITSHVTVSNDLFFAEMMGTCPGISCVVQHIDILSRFVFTLALNQYLPNQWEFRKKFLYLPEVFVSS